MVIILNILIRVSKSDFGFARQPRRARAVVQAYPGASSAARASAAGRRVGILRRGQGLRGSLGGCGGSCGQGAGSRGSSFQTGTGSGYPIRHRFLAINSAVTDRHYLGSHLTRDGVQFFFVRSWGITKWYQSEDISRKRIVEELSTSRSWISKKMISGDESEPNGVRRRRKCFAISDSRPKKKKKREIYYSRHSFEGEEDRVPFFAQQRERDEEDEEKEVWRLLQERDVEIRTMP
ncbi:hypothetical protein IEQ34_015557 [Dendrobium chrysotoxum]|uniref:Uncharacterized protein n=1 Tax=Dendrobium chrysotoxum TaxID=161865 RepID=A0AAV7GIA1_DENCH|nr:hypothetical protein IEQ34_015557 [Dendrobium chrysotoxum]